MDPMSGLTSQPNLGAIVEALRHTARDTGLLREPLAQAASYWETVRTYYAGFESPMRAGASEVYEHEMPGGQYTNLRQQAHALGIEGRWREVSRAYAEVNRMLGDIVKVTPTSKAVGDLAVLMVTNDLSADDVLDPEREIAFPESIVEYFHGDVGQPPGGFPEALQRKVLKGREPLRGRPGEVLPPVDLEVKRHELEQEVNRPVSDEDLASYLMYPQVFLEFARVEQRYGDVSVLPTPVFFWGVRPDEEVTVEIEHGKTLIIRFLAVGEPDFEGVRSIFFELNGQPREVKVRDRSLAAPAARRQADPDDPGHHVAPMGGLVASVAVETGQRVASGDRLATVEAMKMETAVFAEIDGVVDEIVAAVGTHVDAEDLLLVVRAADDDTDD
jgi:pyruvate carboxylase